jgi:large subunit ribosomal protein L7/L12
MRAPLTRLVRGMLSQQRSSQNMAVATGRCFCTSPSTPQEESSSVGSEKVRSLADNILGLTVLEASQLSEILRDRLNIQKPAFGGMAMPMMMAGAPAAAPAGGDAAAAAPAEEKKEKTEFNVKLESFAAEAKIKVIKEIRAITNLGLKEAKELVGSRGPCPLCCSAYSFCG